MTVFEKRNTSCSLEDGKNGFEDSTDGPSATGKTIYNIYKFTKCTGIFLISYRKPKC